MYLKWAAHLWIIQSDHNLALNNEHVVNDTAIVTSSAKTEATCEAGGVTTYTATYTLGEDTYTDTKDVTDIPAKGHDYEAEFTFSEDGKTATVKLTCKNDNEHVVNGDATVTSEVTTPATCTTNGIITYTATYKHKDRTYTDTKDVRYGDITGHTEKIIPGKAPTCIESGLTEGKECSVCGEIIVAQEEIPATGHSFIGAVIEANRYHHYARCPECGVIFYHFLHNFDADGIAACCKIS